MGSVAASGGYYIACAAHKIYANPGTITGSIGVIIEFANIEELLGKIGLKSVVIKSGKYKDILSPTRELGNDERASYSECHRQHTGSIYRCCCTGQGYSPGKNCRNSRWQDIFRRTGKIARTR